MRILAFTDIHENMPLLERIKHHVKSERVDLAVCTGDFTVFGRSSKRMLQELDTLGVPLVLIPGNHEDEEEIAQLLARYKNIHWAHERVIDVKGLRFFGFGGRGFHQREPDLETLERKHAQEFTPHTIVLCHAPPYGTALDEVEPDWHVGNESLRELIIRRRPMLVLCGHIHECFHKHDTLAGATLINPGPEGEIIEVEE